MFESRQRSCTTFDRCEGKMNGANGLNPTTTLVRSKISLAPGATVSVNAVPSSKKGGSVKSTERQRVDH